ncbi:RskA family anti-sigma factor [Nocardia thailandica]
MNDERGYAGPAAPPDCGAESSHEVSPAEYEAFRALYRRTAPAAFGLALRVLHRRGLAEEVVREGYRRLRETAGYPAIFLDGVPDGAAPPAAGTVPVHGEVIAAGVAARGGIGSDTALPARPGAGRAGGLPAPGTAGSGPGSPAAAGPGSAGRAGRPPEARGAPAGPDATAWLLAHVHRLAVERLRLDRHDEEDMPWLAASARLGFTDPLDSNCEAFVLAYYGGRTYRALGRELGVRLPVVNRWLGESVDRLAGRCTPGVTGRLTGGVVLGLADAYALDAVAELERHHIEGRLAELPVPRRDQFLDRVGAVYHLLAVLAHQDLRTPPRQLEARVLGDLGVAQTPAHRRGHWTARPPWLRRFGSA